MMTGVRSLLLCPVATLSLFWADSSRGGSDGRGNDHDRARQGLEAVEVVIARLRKKLSPEPSEIVRGQAMAKEMKLLKLGNVCLDGTKIEADASRHSALSHGHIEKLEAQLKAEVQELFSLAEQADQANRIRPFHSAL